MLGLKSQDDWIFNFNIGNIMHLSPINFDDLNKVNIDIVNELSKDQMLEKLLYLTTAYFCIGTEVRFLSNIDETIFDKHDGDMYHSKAMHICSTFLPLGCPMVEHIITSYKKHYLT